MVRRSFVANLENPVNAATPNKSANQVAVVGKNLFKIYAIDLENYVFNESINLKSALQKYSNPNYVCSDIAWNQIDENLIATGASNGHISVWNLNNSSSPGQVYQQCQFKDHNRNVNTLCFHPLDMNLLVSCSQDGDMKLFDIRSRKVTSTNNSGFDSVRDLQFSPHESQRYSICCVIENGSVQFYDTRNMKKAVNTFTAHNGPVLSCDWHPSEPRWLATAGRDAKVKVWDIKQVILEGDNFVGVGDNFTGSRTSFAATGSGSISERSANRSLTRELPSDVSRMEVSRPTRVSLDDSDANMTQTSSADRSSVQTRSGRSSGLLGSILSQQNPIFSVPTIAPISRIRWRPNHRYQITTSCLNVDYNLNIWDIRRTCSSVGVFCDNIDITRQFVWVNQDMLLASGKDNKLYLHFFADSYQPSKNGGFPVGMDMTHFGNISSATPDDYDDYRHAQNCFQSGKSYFDTSLKRSTNFGTSNFGSNSRGGATSNIFSASSKSSSFVTFGTSSSPSFPSSSSTTAPATIASPAIILSGAPQSLSASEVPPPLPVRHRKSSLSLIGSSSSSSSGTNAAAPTTTTTITTTIISSSSSQPFLSPTTTMAAMEPISGSSNQLKKKKKSSASASHAVNASFSINSASSELTRTSSGSREFLSTAAKGIKKGIKSDVPTPRGTFHTRSSSLNETSVGVSTDTKQTPSGFTSSILSPGPSTQTPASTSTSVRTASVSTPSRVSTIFDQTKSFLEKIVTTNKMTSSSLSSASASAIKSSSSDMIKPSTSLTVSASLRDKSDDLKFGSKLINYSNVNENLNVDYFPKLASEYQLEGKCFDDLCDNNSDAAYRMSKRLISASWKLIKLLYGDGYQLNLDQRINYLTESSIADYFGDNKSLTITLNTQESVQEVTEDCIPDADTNDIADGITDKVTIRQKMVPSSVCSKFLVKRPFPDEVTNDHFKDGTPTIKCSNADNADKCSSGKDSVCLASTSFGSHVIIESFKEETVSRLIKEGLIKDNQLIDADADETPTNMLSTTDNNQQQKRNETIQCVISYFDISPSLLTLEGACDGSGYNECSLNNSFSDLREEAFLSSSDYQRVQSVDDDNDDDVDGLIDIMNSSQNRRRKSSINEEKDLKEKMGKIHKILSQSSNNLNLNNEQIIELINEKVDTTSNLLFYLAYNGDVQTIVSILIVLGQDRVQALNIDPLRLEQWFNSYIDLLHKFQLWKVSTTIIKLSHLVDINNMNQESTIISVSCGKCGKLNHGSGPFICKNCDTETCLCSVCNETVYGLYVWCEGCAHGGHLLHMLDWYQEHRQCPCPSCGHECEYQYDPVIIYPEDEKKKKQHELKRIFQSQTPSAATFTFVN